MSGVEMTRELRKRGRRDFLVGVTGNALKEDQTEYLDAGVDQLVFIYFSH
jgi:osomolarity two-component system sensor histidine kinase SLN1